MDITIEKLAEILQTGLNANSDNLQFEILANVKDMDIASRGGNRYEIGGKLIQGVLTYMSSDITPVAGIGQRYVSTVLRLAVSKENVESVSQVLQDYIELSVGTQQEFDSYKVIVTFQMPQTMQARIDQYGVNVPFEVLCMFRIIENGVTFSDTKVLVDGVELPILSASLGVTRAEDPATPVSTVTTLNAFKSQAITVSVTLPYLNNSTILQMFNDVYVDKFVNRTYQVTYIDNLHTQGVTYRMKISQMPMSAEPLMNNGLSIVFVEG